MVEKNITIKEFCTGFDTCKTDDDREKYIKDNLMINNYAMLSDKADAIDRISGGSFNREDITINFIIKHILTILSVVDLYTNIKVNYESIIDEYDYLEHSGVYTIIYSCLSRDIDEFNKLLELKFKEIEVNQLSIQATISSSITSIFDKIITNISNHITTDDFRKIFEGIMFDENNMEDETNVEIKEE